MMTSLSLIRCFAVTNIMIILVLLDVPVQSIPVYRDQARVDDTNNGNNGQNAGENVPNQLVKDVINAGDALKFEPDRVLKLPPNEEPEFKLNAEIAKKMTNLPVEKLKPMDHMDGVRMEQDGHVNDHYHKEMFLGGAHEEFETHTFDDDAEDKLKEIINKVDSNSDGVLSSSEMEMWILDNMKEHFLEAKKENDNIFKHLDPDGDGYVTWKEYYVHFLLSRGFEVEKALKHVVDYDDSVQIEQDDKDLLISYKFKWTDADHNPTDNRLSKAEFMIFRHPEQSQRSLDNLVKNVLNGIDTNEDGVVSVEEYAALPPGEVEGKEFEEMDRKWQEDRRKEFHEIMDRNQNGFVDRDELKKYLDPTNPIQAKLEADSLISMMDDDKTGDLSVDEILKHSDLFISSKLVNFAANVHDEF